MSIFRRMILAGLLTVFAVGSASESFGQDVRTENVELPAMQMLERLDVLEEQLAGSSINDDVLRAIRGELEDIVKKALSYRTGLSPNIENLRSQVAKLGPEPEKGAPKEADGITAERERLRDRAGMFETAAKKAELAETRARQLMSRILELRRTMFADETLKRWQSPFSPSLWRQVYYESPIAYYSLKNVAQDWIQRASPLWRIVFFVFPCVILWLWLSWIADKVAVRFSDWRLRAEVPFFRRAVSAVAISLARMLPTIAASGLFYFYLSSIGTFTPQTDKFAWSIIFAIGVFVMISALARTMLAPQRSQWRLFALADDAASRLYVLVRITAAIYAFDILWWRANEILHTPLSFTLVESFVASLIFAVLVSAMLLTPLRAPEDQQTELFHGPKKMRERLWPWWLKLPIWGGVFAIVVAAMLGYIPLANFIAGQLLVSGALLVIAFLIYEAINEFCGQLLLEGGPLDGGGNLGVEFSEPRRRQISALMQIVLQLMLFALVLPLFLVQWGFAWEDIQGWFSAAFFGFKLGSIEFSLISVLVAIAVFAAGVLVTRMVQRWLGETLLRSPPMNAGVSHSLNVGVGYLGYVLAALTAFSYTGFDFTNLAIVAGALSVGIGFGLQSIVNNFVSGVILLVERPIRVGDWVIVGEHQGYVRRISVRSTEIETFDRSTVIVPNSDLMTSTVENWTHGDTIGRITVGVGVSYDSNPRKVHDVLLMVANEHPDVLDDPAPLVVFEDFGASSLDFTLRVYVANIRESLKIRTDIRVAVFDALGKEKIDIPFPQRDVYIKNDLSSLTPGR